MRRLSLILVLLTLFTSFAGGSEEEARGQVIYIVPIQGEIDRAMHAFIRRSTNEARRAGADVVIFEIDTPGGRVDSALQITTLIGSLDDLLTIAYVPSDAETAGISWSAGALISFSCDRIYMSPGTSIGAAAPVFVGPDGMVMAPEKVVSALRSHIASLAEKNNYPVGVALAMVDEDVILLEVEIEGEIHAITQDEFDRLEQTAEEEQKPKRIRMIADEGKLLTLTAGDAEIYRVSSGTVPKTNTLIELLSDELDLSVVEIVRLEKTWADIAVGFITSSTLMGLLLMIGLVALYMEISSPGFGVPGTVGIIALAVTFGAQALLGNVGSVEILLILAGLILLILEIFIIPGFGIPGITGILLILGSLVFMQQPFYVPDFDWQWGILYFNMLIVSLFAVMSFVLMGVLTYFLPQLPLLRRLVQSYELSTAEGFVVQTQEVANRLIGKRGTAVTSLRPSGKAEIDDEVVPVETEGEFADSGECVKVVDVSGNRIIVRKC